MLADNPQNKHSAYVFWNVKRSAVFGKTNGSDIPSCMLQIAMVLNVF